MFKDFDISFVDENDKALPIIVLAGVNGSGKTTLLEYIHNYKKEVFPWGKPSMESYDSIYFSTDTSIENVKELMPEYLRKIVWDEDIKASEAFERVRDFANNIFKDIDIQIEFDSRDGEKNLYFRNKSGGDRFLIEELSTGEKTLISKVLYMYLEDIKDKVILIDEPELSLHPSWQNKVLKIYENFAKQNNCQIILATHSPHIIGSAKNEYLRILRKNEDGNIEVIENLKAHGRDINSILFDVMGEVAYRPKEFDDKIDRLHIAIDDRKMEEAQER
jgi:predicted ATP-binding protein involved in virulence